MNPEMKAKVDEFLKARKAAKELSMDKMDKVAGGGSWDSIPVNGVETSKADFDALMVAVADSFGYSVAAEMFEEITGFPCLGSRALDCSHSNHVNDKRLMAEALEEFWTVRRLGNYGPN